MRALLLFGSGGIVFGNLVQLLPTNPNYEASWLNIVLGCAMALGAALKRE